MALSPRLLGDGETVLVHTRTHAKALAGPALILIALLIVAGLGAAYADVVPGSWRTPAGWTLGIALLLAAVALVLVPVLRWATTTYTVTTRRIITRRGLITRTGHDLPITRINDVSYTRDLLDRMLGCGTLVLTTASEVPVRLYDIPDVEAVHLRVADLLFAVTPHAETTTD